MGVVYEAWDELLARPVAIKVVRRARIGDAAAARRAWMRAVAEARITARLEHPGIVPVHDLGVDEDGGLFFVMRLVRGFDLARLLEARPGWPLRRLVGVLQRVCVVASFAHAHGVVHRDLKPSNVRVGESGETYALDWGLASMCDAFRSEGDPPAGERAHADDPAELEGTIFGTPAYMSPEQARGDADVSGPGSDVYSIGAILYEMLAGRPPYLPPGLVADPRVIHRWLLAGPPDPLREIAPNAPPELVAVCERAMERNPACRYPDAAELGRELERWLAGRPIRGRSLLPCERFRCALARARPRLGRLARAAALALLLPLSGMREIVPDPVGGDLPSSLSRAPLGDPPDVSWLPEAGALRGGAKAGPFEPAPRYVVSPWER